MNFDWRCIGQATAGVLVVCSCTWTRFDDISDNPPVERFDAPSEAANLGQNVVTFDGPQGAHLVAEAHNNVVLYALGTGVDPARSAATNERCTGDASCHMAQQLAGLSAASWTGEAGCAAYGIGWNADVAAPVVWLLCDDALRRSLPVPDEFAAWMTENGGNSNIPSLFATSRETPQPLAVAVPDAGATWYYANATAAPTLLPALPNGEAIGRSLAVLPSDFGHWVLGGSTSAEDTLWVYRMATSEAPALAGCVTGGAKFGRLLATGNFDGDSVADVAIADAQGVSLISGSSLTTLTSGAGSCVAADSLPLLGRISCARTAGVDGCAGTTFATSMAAANLDATGPDELVIGAPYASVGGEAAAGAAVVYANSAGSWRAAQGLYVSSASAGDLLGTSLATHNLAGAERIIAGAPGANAVMVFYCNSLTPGQAKSARCH